MENLRFFGAIHFWRALIIINLISFSWLLAKRTPIESSEESYDHRQISIISLLDGPKREPPLVEDTPPAGWVRAGNIFSYSSSIISETGLLTDSAISGYLLNSNEVFAINRHLKAILIAIIDAEKTQGVIELPTEPEQGYQYLVPHQSDTVNNLFANLQETLISFGLAPDKGESLAKLIPMSAFFQENLYERRISISSTDFDIIIVCASTNGERGEMIVGKDIESRKNLAEGVIQKRYAHVVDFGCINEFKSKIIERYSKYDDGQTETER